MHLKRLMTKHGLKQTDLARILRRDKSVITNLFQGKRQLKADEAALIARHIGVSLAELLGIREQGMRGFAENVKLIPFRQEPEHIKKQSNIVRKDGQFFLEVSETSGYSAKAFALEMTDESMNLAGILPGDVVISELDLLCRSGQIVVAQQYIGRGARTIIRAYDRPLLLPRSTSAAFKPLNEDTADVRVVSPVLKVIRTL